MGASNGRTLKLFLVDGVPNGLLTAEIMNWTGHVITGPRGRLGELIQRPESRRTGVYFLVGPELGPGMRTKVYIGETDDVTQRLTAHNRPEDKGGKDFWEKVCVVTSKDANLTKGHIKYLESRLIKIAQLAERCELLNGTDPSRWNVHRLVQRASADWSSCTDSRRSPPRIHPRLCVFKPQRSGSNRRGAKCKWANALG